MDIFATYAVNEDLENNGTWMEVGDARFLVARAGNKAYAKMFTKEYERNHKALERKDDSADKLAEQIMIKVIAKTILLGWENVKFKGEDLPYSLANAEMLLGLKDFRREIVKLADDFDSFKAQKAEEDEKN